MVQTSDCKSELGGRLLLVRAIPKVNFGISLFSPKNEKA